ncbi:MAG: hypothetical protein IPO63_17530 [Bacteroidetes bacterium]|nr:hypothetical protein [Bacteroidota bacterium]
MKKSLLILAMFIGGAVTAQDNMTSKKGTPILPEAGDWSIGIGANSTLEYFGNLMNGNNSAPSFDWQSSPNVIRFKMMKDENTAYRAGVRIGYGSDKETYEAPNVGDQKDEKTSQMAIDLAGGIQKYRGKGRLRGYYGGEAGIGFGSMKTTNTYNGNAAAGETLEDKQGGTFSFALRGFIGAEYFFAPKMSVSGEFGWGLDLSTQGASDTKTADGNGGSTSTKGGKSSSFSFDTDNASGAIVLNLYF